MIVDELILQIKGDLDLLKKDFAEIKKSSEKAGQEAGKSFSKGMGKGLSETEKELKKVNDEIRELEAPGLLSNAKQKLKNLKDGVTEVKTESTNLVSVIKGVAAAISAVKIGQFFKGAIESADKLQQSLLKVESSAKAYGQSAEGAKQASQDLAKDGFLSVEESATAISNLMASGLNLEQVKKFVEAEKNIGAFGNTIGNASQAVVDLTKGILTNSAEVIENLSPAMKTINSQYQKQVEQVGKAKAVQFLYTETLKLSNKFQGDAAKFLETSAAAQKKFAQSVDDAKAAIGEGLQPVLIALSNTFKPLIDGFTDFFRGLSGTQKTALLIGTTMTALIPIVSAAVNAFKAFKGTSTIFTAITSAMNPLTLALTGITIAVTGLIILIDSWTNSTENMIKAEEKQTDQLLKLNRQVKSLEDSRKAGIDTQKDEIDVKDALRKASEELGVQLEKEDLLTENLAKTQKKLVQIQQIDLAQKITSLRISSIQLDRLQEEQEIRLATLQGLSGLGEAGTGFAQTGSEAQINKIKQQRQRVDDQAQRLEASLNKLINPLGESIGTRRSSGDLLNKSKILEDNLFLLDDFTKKLKNNRKEFEEFINFVEQEKTKGNITQDIAFDLKSKAESELLQRTKDLADKQQKIIDESLKSQFEKELDSLKDQQNQKLESIDSLRLARLRTVAQIADFEWLTEEEIIERNEKIRQDHAKQKLEIEKAFLRKKSELETKQLQEQASKTADFLSGVKNILSAESGQDVLSGIGGAISAINPALGGAINSLSTISGLLGDIFGNEAELKQQEEERKKLLETQNKILESQRKNMEVLNQLEIERGNIIDKETDLQLKLNAIEFAGDDEARRKADIAALTTLKTQKETDIGLAGGTPQQVGSQIKDLFGKKIANEAALTLINNMPRLTGSENFSQTKSILSAQSNILGQILSTDVSPEVKSEVQRNKNQIDSLSQITEVELAQKALERGLRAGDFISRFSTNVIASTSGLGNIASKITGEQGLLTDRASDAEKLLDVIQKIQDLSGQTAVNTADTAKNTSKVLELAPDRERSVIDIGLGFISSLGQKITGASTKNIVANLNSQNLQLPSEIGTASVIAIKARSLQERMVDALEKQVMQGEKVIDLLSDIMILNSDLVAIADNNPATNSGFTVEDLNRVQAERERRRR